MILLKYDHEKECMMNAFRPFFGWTVCGVVSTFNDVIICVIINKHYVTYVSSAQCLKCIFWWRTTLNSYYQLTLSRRVFASQSHRYDLNENTDGLCNDHYFTICCTLITKIKTDSKTFYCNYKYLHICMHRR